MSNNPRDQKGQWTMISQRLKNISFTIQNPIVIHPMQTNATRGIKIAKDSITYCTSGLVDRNKGTTLSYLHKAIKSLNQLRMIEDSLVIYRLSRAPERRIFYIDVGNLPKIKAEQYLRDVMMRYRNKLVYDASTGEIRDEKKHSCQCLKTSGCPEERVDVELKLLHFLEVKTSERLQILNTLRKNSTGP